jgi:hypothetical protein
MSRNRNIWALGATLAVASTLASATGIGPVDWFASGGAHAQDASLEVGSLMSAYKAERQRWIHHEMSTKQVLGVPRTTLDSIADCESHGDPRSIGGGGLYRGKYQFDRGTWASVGGKGDPVEAPEYEQDRRAAMLLKRSGSSPWPVCG